MSRRVMILGAGREQVPVLKTTIGTGAEIILISPPGNYPGFRYAHRYYYCDVRDRERVLEIAKHERVDAILSDQLDAAVLTTAYVAEVLGLPGIGCSVAEKFTNKLVMRQAAAEIGIKVPLYSGAATIREAYQAAQVIGYPVIIKPADSAASRGVFKVDDHSELGVRFVESLSYSRIGQVIIEQIISGKEYVVQSFSRDTQASNLIIGHRDFFDFPFLFIPRAAVYIDAAAAQTNAEQMVLAIHARLVEGLGLEFGIAYGEYLYCEDSGDVYLVEIAARGAGTFTSSDLIPLACGMDASQMLVEAALGLEPSYQSAQRKMGSAAYFCFILPPGRVTTIENVHILKEIPGFYKAFLDNVAIGMQISETKHKGSRKGPVLVFGKTKQECYDTCNQVKNVLRIDVETESGDILGIQW